MSPEYKVWGTAYLTVFAHLDILKNKVEVHLTRGGDWPAFAVCLKEDLALYPAENVRTLIATLRLLQPPTETLYIYTATDTIEILP